jgi:hypothetical protein
VKSKGESVNTKIKIKKLIKKAGHTKPGSIIHINVNHDNGCRAIRTQRFEDCTCNPIIETTGGIMQIVQQVIIKSDCGRFREIYSIVERDNGEIIGLRHFGEVNEPYDALEEFQEIELAESTPEGRA